MYVPRHASDPRPIPGLNTELADQQIVSCKTMMPKLIIIPCTYGTSLAQTNIPCHYTISSFERKTNKSKRYISYFQDEEFLQMYLHTRTSYGTSCNRLILAGQLRIYSASQQRYCSRLFPSRSILMEYWPLLAEFVVQ